METKIITMLNLVKSVLFVLLIITLGSRNVNSQEPIDKTAIPDRIMLTIPSDPATSRAVTWRTENTTSATIGQITMAQSTPFFEDKIVSVTGTSAWWESDNTSALGHRVNFTDLQPNSIYSYRVGNGNVWSEWFQFTTSSEKNEPFNFLYLGDFQNDIKQFCSRTIRQAYSHFPNSDFILFVGDLVSRSTEDYWSEFFYAGNWIFGTIPTVATPGNHEYTSLGENQPRVFSRHWNQIFTNPNNGVKNIENRTFYMDYQGVRFISIDSPAMGYTEENSENTLKWLSKILAENPNTWSIVFTHYPVYSCSQGRNNNSYRNKLKPILEKYGVDLVLQGHDHTYCRGQNLEEVGADCENPPMYMVSVSGPKMYGLNVNKWSDRAGSQMQLYQNIKVDAKTIEVEVYTVTGTLYDKFTLKKNKKGVNMVLESPEINNIQQHVEIPENAIIKYTEEELKLYKQKF